MLAGGMSPGEVFGAVEHVRWVLRRLGLPAQDWFAGRWPGPGPGRIMCAPRLADAGSGMDGSAGDVDLGQFRAALGAEPVALGLDPDQVRGLARSVRVGPVSEPSGRPVRPGTPLGRGLWRPEDRESSRH